MKSIRVVLKLLTMIACAFSVSLPAMADSNGEFYHWLEAENFTTATQDIRIIEADRVPQTSREQQDAAHWLKRSGRDERVAEAISGKGFIEKEPSSKTHDIIQYEFSVPTDDNYYFWFRFNNPPPCQGCVDLWIDSTSNRKPGGVLHLGQWNVWVWWAWGQSENTATPKAIRLSAGKHILFIGDMLPGTKVDKLLVTNVSKYIPAGVNERFYTSTFSPPICKGAGHGWSDKARATDTGWSPFPQERWQVVSDLLSENYYYDVVLPTTNSALTYSLIQKLQGDVFEANLRVLMRPLETGVARDALFIYGWRDDKNYQAIRVAESGLEVLNVQDGTTETQKSIPYPLIPSKKFYDLHIKRTATFLEVSLNSKNLLSARMPYPTAGSFGLGSNTGGVGFDDVIVTPLDDPAAAFNFGDPNGDRYDDWVIRRNSEEKKWEASDKFEKGDLFLYRVPAWANSEVKIGIETNKDREVISALFPYVDPKTFLETKVSRGTGTEIKIELFRHFKGRTESRGQFIGNLTNDQSPELTLQCVKGLFAVFLNGKKTIEVNEYEILNGRLGFLMHDDQAKCPIQNVAIQKKNIIVDNFQVNEIGSLDPMWEIKEGNWKVSPVMEGEGGEGDGQLTIQGKGTALLGKDGWCTYVTQVSALMDESSEFAIVGWEGQQGPGTAMELFCRSGEVQLRKVVSGNVLVLATASVPALKNGWHKLSLALNKDSLVGEVDGQEYLSTPVPQGQGRAGLRNYGKQAVFDNLSIYIVSEKPEKKEDVRHVDQGFIDIEDNLLK